MREIKFRAWDIEVNKMIYLKEDYGEAFLSLPMWDTIRLMQYTGLKDKNGKEIYEWDILKDSEGNLYIVDFIRGCFYLRTKYPKNIDGWVEWLPMCEIDRLAFHVDFEVVGNIYQTFIRGGINNEQSNSNRQINS